MKRPASVLCPPVVARHRRTSAASRTGAPIDHQASARPGVHWGCGAKRIRTLDGTIELNVQSHAVFAVALMPTRVFSTAAAAEHSAWNRIDSILRGMTGIRRLLNRRELTVNARLLDELQAAHSTNQIVLRTYLTSAAGYRRHLVGGSASDDLKDAVLDLHLPHFTWITEISTIDSHNQASPGLRRIYGHTVLDATSTGKGGDGLLLLHLPGLLVTNDVNAQEDPEKVAIIQGDTLYECREKRL